MDIYLLLLVANYVTGNATPPVMPQLYATMAFEGVEVSGLTRVAVFYEAPETISDTEVLISSLTAVGFDNTPAGSADEVWIYDATSGGNRWWITPIVGGPITLTDGGNKTFPAGDVSHTIKTVAA